jgi:hypothetical protein
MDVDHAEVVEVAAGAARGMLALGEAALLLGLERGLAGLFSEHGKGLLLGHREELGGDPRGRVLGLGDLGCLIQGDLPVLEGLFERRGVVRGLGRRQRLFALGDRGPGDPGELGGLLETAGEGCDPEAREALDAHVDLELAPGLGRAQQGGL